MLYSYNPREGIFPATKNSDIFIREFSRGDRLVMTGMSFDFRKYNVANTNKFMRRYLGETRKIAKTRQRHTKNVVSLPAPGEYIGVDGFVTTTQPVMVVTADCVPLLLRHKEKPLAALVHAGWRGVWQQIHLEAIRQMRVDPRELEAYLCPSIGLWDFDVRDDFLAHFAERRHFENFIHRRGDKTYVDLQRFLARELHDAGLDVRAIHIDGHSTRSSRSFHSYRREGQTYGLNAIFYLPRE